MLRRRGDGKPSRISRCGGLRLSFSADVRAPDDVIAFEGLYLWHFPIYSLLAYTATNNILTPSLKVGGEFYTRSLTAVSFRIDAKKEPPLPRLKRLFQHLELHSGAWSRPASIANGIAYVCTPEYVYIAHASMYVWHNACMYAISHECMPCACYVCIVWTLPLRHHRDRHVVCCGRRQLPSCRAILPQANERLGWAL